jgi:DNA-binding HxlR family transcriptional regulator
MKKSQENLFALFGDRWSLMIVDCLLQKENRRFVEIKAELNCASPTTLSHKLKKLTEMEIVEKSTGQSHLDVRYSLTEKGQDMKSVIKSMKSYFEKYLGSKECPNQQK